MTTSKPRLSIKEYAKRRIPLLGNLSYRKAMALMIILQDLGYTTITVLTLKSKIKHYIAGETSQVNKYVEILKEEGFTVLKRGVLLLNYMKVPNDPEIRDIYLESLYLKKWKREYYNQIKREHSVLFNKSYEAERLENFSRSQKEEDVKNNDSPHSSSIEGKKEEEPERERKILTERKNA